jgi:hypothetical protein
MASQPTRGILISQAKGIVKWSILRRRGTALRAESGLGMAWQQFQGEFLMTTETRQQSPARQMFRYIGTTTMILVVVAGLFWGFFHI